jgi:hypothetical protein
VYDRVPLATRTAGVHRSPIQENQASHLLVEDVQGLVAQLGETLAPHPVRPRHGQVVHGWSRRRRSLLPLLTWLPTASGGVIAEGRTLGVSGDAFSRETYARPDIARQQFLVD